jgi:FixJ family two-component response regulator
MEQAVKLDAGLKIIIYSRYKDFNIAVKAFRLGIVDYILQLDEGNYTQNLLNIVQTTVNRIETNLTQQDKAKQLKHRMKTLQKYAVAQLLNCGG